MSFMFRIKEQTITYTLLRSIAAVDEGMQFTITLNTTGVNPGTQIPYTITGVSSADLGGASLSGNFTVSGLFAAGTASVVFTTAADFITEGPETFTISLDNGLASAQVLVNDTAAAAQIESGVVLLLKAEGANNQDNNTFIDSSANNYVVT